LAKEELMATRAARVLSVNVGPVREFEYNVSKKSIFGKTAAAFPCSLAARCSKRAVNEAVVFVLDLTERKRAEEALRESERHLRSAIDGIPGLVSILAPNGDVQAVNHQVVEYFGRPFEELRNWGTNEMVHPEIFPISLKYLRDLHRWAAMREFNRGVAL
jgi:PAS domain-containing protein